MKKIKIISLSIILLLYAFTINAQEYKLPKLNYSYSALEPHIDARTMEIHYTKHHKTYVDNLNKTIRENNWSNRTIEDMMLNVSKYNKEIRNNGGGHYNHTLFWEVLTPNSQTRPEGRLSQMIDDSFGSFDNFKKEMNDAASSRFGSGWAWLILTKNNQLAITSTPNQDNPLMDVIDERGIPILGIDVWEHAYYLKYQNKRADYLQAIWNVIDWKKVEQNLNSAMNSETLRKL